LKSEELFAFIKAKLEEFEKAERFSFGDFLYENGKPRKPPRRDLKFNGVYVVYEGENPIYVGSTGGGKKRRHTLHDRLRDLFYDYKGATEGQRRYYHTLTRKLLKGKNKRFNSLDEVRRFLFNKCKVRVLRIDSISLAKVMESVLIALLEPWYNSETQAENWWYGRR